MAITASFIPGAGLLSVFGDDLDNAVTISRNAAGLILINGGAVQVIGGQPTVANTTQMVVFGQAGNDMLVLDESNGALPPAQMFGGAGNDTIVGGSGGDLLFGQAGNDTLLGKGGNDFLFGGAGNDTLTGGDGDDQVFGEGGNDRMIWNPGDDTDLFEGGDGTDTAEVNGGNGAEVFTATANGTRVRFDRLDPAPFSLDIGTTEKLVVNMNGGDDSFSATGNLAALISVTVDGGAGNDTILGSNGADTLHRRRRQRFHRRPAGQRPCPARRRRRRLPVGSRRRQRHGRGRRRQRHDVVQRLQRQRDHGDLGQWRADAAHPRPRHHHHGPQRHRARPDQRPGRRRQDHGQQPRRHRRQAGRHQPGRDGRGGRRRGRPGDRQRHQRQRPDQCRRGRAPASRSPA